MKKIKKSLKIIMPLLIFIGLVYVGNFTIMSFFLKRNYSYSNYNQTFTYYEDRLKGKSYNGRDNNYESFLKDNPDIKDKQLYRTFTLDPWRFWEWHEWYYHYDRFKLPYISEKEIKKNREKEGLDRQ